VIAPKTSSPVRIATLQPPSTATGACSRIAASAPETASAGSSPAPHEASVIGGRPELADGSTISTCSALSAMPARSAASRARSAGATPRSARSPSAATAACSSDWRRSRRSVSSRSVMSRPTASSIGPSSSCTMPQLISPTNSLPSRRSPQTSVENRSGCSVAK